MAKAQYEVTGAELGPHLQGAIVELTEGQAKSFSDRVKKVEAPAKPKPKPKPATVNEV